MDEQQQKLLKLTSKLTLLYVEDEDCTREQYESIFSLLFKDVKSAVNGKEALEIYKQKKYDLIITDLTMPKMGGIELISEITKINPIQKIIVMTAHNTNKTFQESIHYHVDGYLLKPVSMETLLTLLYKVCSDLSFRTQKSHKDDSLNWLNFIIQALENDDLIPYYQPIIDANTYEVNSYQVLARIKNHEDYILPKYFINLSKKSGLIEDISKAIIDHSYEIFSKNNKCFHIDVVDVPWEKDTLEEYLEQLNSKYKIDRSRIILDILDHDSLKPNSSKTKKILKLKDQGYKISLKDFKVGRINVEVLSLLKPDYIKVDKATVENAQNDQITKEALMFLVEYTKKVGIKTILVGVDSEDIFNVSKSLDFDFLQGFYIAKPSKKLSLFNKSFKG